MFLKLTNLTLWGYGLQSPLKTLYFKLNIPLFVEDVLNIPGGQIYLIII